MPLVALLDGIRVEAPTLIVNEEWHRISGAGDRLTCPGCGQRMIGKRGAQRVAHFAHFRQESACTWGLGESAAHLKLKWAVCQIIRAVPGWTAELEIANENRTWRADVLARGDARTIAFEVQLAPQTIEETAERCQRFAEDEVEAVWLAHRRVAWLDTHAALLVDQLTNEVTGGLWKFSGCWTAVEPQPLDKIVRAILAGKMVWERLPDRAEYEPRFRHHAGGGWTTQRYLTNWREARERAHREEQERIRKQTEHEDNARRRVERVISVRDRVLAALDSVNLSVRSHEPQTATAFGHCFVVEGRHVVCEPLSKELWRLPRLGEGTIAIFQDNSRAVAAAAQGRRSLRIFTVDAVESNQALFNLFPPAPPRPPRPEPEEAFIVAARAFNEQLRNEGRSRRPTS